jgi:hypothetical protein
LRRSRLRFALLLVEHDGRDRLRTEIVVGKLGLVVKRRNHRSPIEQSTTDSQTSLLVTRERAQLMVDREKEKVGMDREIDILGEKEQMK